ncbi:hypothetical protein FRB95_011999 [Tulasnella sp. JGI-2019a]|nr:hypothetical protein FRB93_007219 [Tulasnella sp. JGI-2019a]KAG9035132.1 hypothetical protein FRB95_011999 [Tulasnella sp. JGI-2019a]
MPVTEITSLAQFKEIIAKDEYSVMDFWATWCGPCRVISPVFEKMAEQFTNVKCYKIDVDTQSEISQECGIRAMPTFMAFKNGQKVKDMMGANPPALEQLLKSLT